MWVPVFFVLFFTLIAYLSRNPSIDYPSKQASSSGPSSPAPSKEPSFDDDPYLKTFLFLQNVFVLYLVDKATDQEIKKIQQTVKRMDTEDMRVVETFEIDKRSFQEETLFHAKSLVMTKEKVLIHHLVMSYTNNSWDVIASSLASEQYEEFSESFTHVPTYSPFKSMFGSTKKINPILLM